MNKLSVILNQRSDYGHMGDSDHMSGWGNSWMWIMPLVLLAIIVVTILWTISNKNSSSTKTEFDHAHGARALLAERFAKDEISSEEYKEKLSILNREK